MKTRFITLILCLFGSIVYTQIGFYEHDILNNSLVSDVGEALCTELPTGFYFLKILDSEGNFVVKKVVKR